MGEKHARVLIFHERAAIETMVLEKGRVEACNELRGEKRVSLKPPIDALAIAWSHEAHSQVHIMKWSQRSLDRNREAPFE